MPRLPWKTLSDVEFATAEYVDRYNPRGCRGGTGHVPPVEHGNNHCLTTTKPRLTPDI
ncbi:hypothetical protein [Streptomyces griseoflavus]|uniref:hypothetical protein n=1 Tax=Streptomyces griseoflavus TaxID=35619 RepID=UPI0002E14268|nr:hypothetical protein [Streptomyces griseoflavus]